ncbi:hypothetical protein YTPLAS18_35160 [Nitrospira sp.]|nr:hypothetical protein YTPLAS18_35160 [Nitrospira sp.]
MKTNILMGCAAVGCLSLVLQVGQWVYPMLVPAQAQELRPIKYRIVDVSLELHAMQRMLDEYGAAGWELVAVGLGDVTSHPRLIFRK